MGIKETLFGTAGEKNTVSNRYIDKSMQGLFAKAYMIEFYETDEKTPKDVFTFSVPPKSEELGYSQRKTETKTFGGLHIDEYGMDAAKITLSGSTINQSLKRIYSGAYKSSKWLSGEEEIYYLRDLLQKYRSLDNLQKSAKGKIIIYDLSKLTASGNGNMICYCWQAFPGEFKIRRSDDKPFTYNYSFEFTAIPLRFYDTFNSHGEPPKLNPAKLGLIQELMNGLTTALDFVDGINAAVNNVLDAVNQTSGLIKVLGNVMTYSTDTLSGIADSAGKTAAGFIDGATSVVNGANSIVSLPRTIQLKALNVGLDVQNATNRLMKATAGLTETCRGMFDPDGDYWSVPQEVLDQRAMNNEEFKDSINRMLNQAENAANELAAAAKSADIPDVTAGNPDPETGEARIVLSYGSIEAALDSTDTLESLAAEYMGNPDRAIDIAAFNGVASLTDLQPGDTIRIPITQRTKQSANNRIYARREDRDNYGRDVLITDEGYIVVSNNGDYALAAGVRNLTQAVLLRLRESVKKRIRITAYGIRTNISDPTAGKAYILASIELTVSSDPRVSSVDSIKFKSLGDYLDVVVNYSDINRAGGNVSGRV